MVMSEEAINERLEELAAEQARKILRKVMLTSPEKIVATAGFYLSYLPTYQGDPREHSTFADTQNSLDVYQRYLDTYTDDSKNTPKLVDTQSFLDLYRLVKDSTKGLKLADAPDLFAAKDWLQVEMAKMAGAHVAQNLADYKSSLQGPSLSSAFSKETGDNYDFSDNKSNYDEGFLSQTGLVVSALKFSIEAMLKGQGDAIPSIAKTYMAASKYPTLRVEVENVANDNKVDLTDVLGQLNLSMPS